MQRPQLGHAGAGLALSPSIKAGWAARLRLTVIQITFPIYKLWQCGLQIAGTLEAAMDCARLALEQNPRQQRSILTNEELSRLWNAAISDDDLLVHEVIHDLGVSHGALKDGVFLF